jgi:hypothetical protein
MHTEFSLFSSHLDLAHAYWSRLLQAGDTAIDATCGNGHDTLKLAALLSGKGTVIGIDIQPQALAKTHQLLTSKLTPEELSQVTLYEQSHVQFPHLDTASVRLIVYNLGYLPRSDKTIKTQESSTLQSVRAALELIVPGGAVSITCYPGHPEGKEEQTALLGFVSSLSPRQWNICHHQWANSPLSPSLLLIQKQSLNTRAHHGN